MYRLRTETYHLRSTKKRSSPFQIHRTEPIHHHHHHLRSHCGSSLPFPFLSASFALHTSKMPSSTWYIHDGWAAGNWVTDGRTDEDESTGQSTSWGSWADVASRTVAWETDGWTAWDRDSRDNRHPPESTEITDPGGSPSTGTSDIASTGGPSAGWSSSEHAWPAWESSGWVDPSEDSSTQDRMEMQKDWRRSEKALFILQLLVDKVNTMEPCLLTCMPDASRPSSSSIRMCTHFATNTNQDCFADLENQHVTNATLVESSREFDQMAHHLEGTVLYEHADIGTAFRNIFGRYRSRYRIQYSKAQANRFVLIQCSNCGCGFYGVHPRWSKTDTKEFISEFADFLNVEIKPGATQV